MVGFLRAFKLDTDSGIIEVDMKNVQKRRKCAERLFIFNMAFLVAWTPLAVGALCWRFW